MESVWYLVTGLATLLVSVFIFRWRLRAKAAAAELRVSRLAADLRAGGAGLVGGAGRVEGEVGVHVLGGPGGCVGVATCPAIQVNEEIVTLL